ncbi:transcriptional regulator [Streptomyces sp. 3N207]|uniref:transcriptional regulator n=1 Tax=Streptomyces sp. 3N207 TaxID=3457417 RepID=UPI003FD4C218
MSGTGQAGDAGSDAVGGLEQLLLDPTRLTILSLVSATNWCDFAFVRDHAHLRDSALSKQLTTLRNAELVEIRKGYVGKRPRTWVRATAVGRERLRTHLAALKQIADRAEQAAAARSDADAEADAGAGTQQPHTG